MIATLRDFMKQYQSRLLRPFNSPASHTGSIQPVTQAQEQPMPGLVLDPVQSQASAEERYFAGQIASGFQVMQTGMVEFAFEETNARLFMEQQSQLPGVPDVPDPFGWDALIWVIRSCSSRQVMPQSPCRILRMFGLGGW